MTKPTNIAQVYSLREYIDQHHGGTQSSFARALGKKRKLVFERLQKSDKYLVVVSGGKLRVVEIKDEVRQGDCDLCGNWSGRLMDGECVPCHAKRRPHNYASESKAQAEIEEEHRADRDVARYEGRSTD